MTVRKAVTCKWLLFLLFSQAFIARAQLSANFSATPVSGCAPLLVNFTDLSTGNPTSWKWDLGNGTISFLKNPAVTYFASGQYNVKLTVTNAGGTNEITKTQFITVYAIPAINFVGTPLTGCYPLPVQFSDQSIAGSGTIDKYEWDFGDGNISSAKNPAHIYNIAGNFNVSLRGTNSYGCITTTSKTQYINIANGAKAAFTFSAPPACTLPVTVNFSNTSTGGGLSYEWDFGDGITSTATNPSHNYSTKGTYTVRLITKNSSGCIDTLIKINAVTVGGAKADFALPAATCINTPLTFVNTSSSLPIGAMWDFGDGVSYPAINPTKAYSTAGTFTIKMVADFGACKDSVSKSITISPKPVISFSSDKTGACKPPATINFTSAVAGGSSYIWYFGDGTTSTLQNPSHTYNSYGAFNVKLVVTNTSGCKDSLVKKGYIKIKPTKLTIDGLPAKGCAPLTHTFSATVNSVDVVTAYLWNFGDGTTSTLANPTHTFPAGKYTISVIVTTAGGCSDTATVIDGILAGNKPTVNFSATPRDVCAKIPVVFTDLSTGVKADEWLWFFGDGTTSTDHNPEHPYQDTGYFDITLVAWNNGCPDTLKFPDYIHITPPIAIFEVTGNCGTPKERLFIDHSIGADTWQWDFGDGTTSTLQNPPLHIYPDTGTYKVSLTVTNFKTGCSYTQVQQVLAGFSKADFVASDTAICVDSKVYFHAKSPDVVSYYWKYGDGVEGFGGPYPDYTYTKAGQYSVTLIIVDKYGCKDSLVKNLYIKVGAPMAAFGFGPKGTCLNSPVVFNDSTLAEGFPIQKWIWNFGDSTTQTFTAPPFQHTYAKPGMYDVTLTVIDSRGCADSVGQSNTITISKPVAYFSSDDTMSCHLQTITFTNLSNGSNLKYYWDFGDGASSTDISPVHQYTTQSKYNISLTATDEFGCTDKMVKDNFIVIVDPIADFSMSDSISTCPPLITVFTNLSKNSIKRSWNFGDGTFSSVDNPTHFYNTPGTYKIVLIVTGYNGCTDSITKQVIVRGPVGSFSYKNIIGCNPLKTDFVGKTKDDISFIWDFNDGTTISTADSIISHTYTNPGFYLPKMILVDKGGCQVPIIGTDTIKVYGVKADFTSATNLLCDSGYVTFKDQSQSNDIIKSYLWDFGNGTSSVQQNPVSSYASTGIYTTHLTVITNHGCIDTMQAPTPIRIVASPRIGIRSNDGVCIPATITFSGQVLASDTSSLQWKWDFGNGKTSAQQNPGAQIYLGAGSYNVTAIATNSSGCKDSVTKIVQAYPLPSVKAIVDSTICFGQAINLNATGASTYTWFPSAGLSCSNCASPVAKPDSNMQYTVKGTSANGCVGWDTILLSVRLPFKMQVSKGDTLCIGKSAQIFASGASSYIWSPSSGLNNATIANPLATPSATTNYMVVGKDDKGCFKDTAFVPLKVYPIPTVNAGSDKTINVGMTLDLDPTLSPDVTNTVWTPTSGIFRNRFPGITVKPPQTTEYTVEVRNEGGCRARDKVTVYVLCNNANVFIPNTFSPNGDGANDIFYPRGTGVFSVKTFRIFNRWGEVVFEKTNFNANDASAGWNGTFKGAKLNPDVFVYTIDIMCENNTILTYKGNVALIQ